MKKYALWLILLANLSGLMTVQSQNPDPLSVHAAFIPGTDQIAIADDTSLQRFDLNFQHQGTIPIVVSKGFNPDIHYLNWGRTGDYFVVASIGSGDPTAVPGDTEVLEIRRFADNQVMAAFYNLSFQGYAPLIDWSMDDTYVAIGSSPNIGLGTVKIVRPEDGVIVNGMVIPRPNSLFALRWNPVALELTLAITVENRTLVLRCDALKSFDECRDVGPVDMDVRGLAFSPDGTQFAFIPYLTDTVGIFDLYTGQVVKTLTGHADFIQNFAWGEHGIVTTSVDKTLRIWNPETAETVSVAKLDDYPAAVILSPDGSLILLPYSRVPTELRDATTGEILAQLDREVSP
jgi:WD40 repeat protein